MTVAWVICVVGSAVKSTFDPEPSATELSAEASAPTPNAVAAKPVAREEVPTAVDSAPVACACTPKATAAVPDVVLGYCLLFELLSTIGLPV